MGHFSIFSPQNPKKSWLGKNTPENKRMSPDFRDHFERILPRKLTCPLKNGGWKTTFLLKWLLFMGHVSFQGCKPNSPMDTLKTKSSPDFREHFFQESRAEPSSIPINFLMAHSFVFFSGGTKVG